METTGARMRAVNQGQAAVQQVSQAIARAAGLTPQSRHLGNSSFSLTRDPHPAGGIHSATGELDGQVIRIRLEIAPIAAGIHAELLEFLRPLTELEHAKLRIDTAATGQQSLVAELTVSAAPLTVGRQSALEREVEQIQKLAVSIQTGARGRPLSVAALDEKYKGVESFVARICGVDLPAGSALEPWVEETAADLEACLCVAIQARASVELQFAVAAIAAAAERRGSSLGRFIHSFLNVRMLPSIAGRAPGWLAVSALQLASGGDSYQISDDIKVALGLLERQGFPLLVDGTFEELQNVFARGQGLSADPLSPVVRAVPEISREDLARFAVTAAAGPLGGLTRSAESEVIQAVLASVGGLSRADAIRILQPAANQALRNWKRGSLNGGVQTFTQRLARQRSTLSGFSTSKARERCEELQQLLNKLALARDPVDFLRAELLGQQAALDELAVRLRKEILMRPSHQPIRWLAQGPPAVGKSESLKLLARRLGVPYAFVDAAAFADVYTATSQLLGAARGLVGSNRPGRLEQAAHQRPGVVLEVADLDHAPWAVQSGVADLFLKPLDEGEGDSATGAPFAFSNVIVVLTMNLHEERRLRNKLGFEGALSREEITTRTITRLTETFSPAFLDRVGDPIVFEPLSREALAGIAQREAVADFKRAAERLRLPVDDLQAGEQLGERLVSRFQHVTSNPGARGLKEHVRELVAEAVAEWALSGRQTAKPLLLTATEEGRVLIEQRTGGRD